MVTRTSGLAAGTKTLLGMFLLTIGFLATLLTLLSFFGGVWWAFDLAANFRFQLGLVLVITGVLYWMTVGKGGAILFLAAGFANIVLVLPLWMGSQAPAAGEDRLNVVTFNVDQEVAARSEILQWLRGVEADLVFLQETTEEWVAAIGETDLGMDVIAVPPDEAIHGTTVLSRNGATAEVREIGSRNDHLVEVSTTLGGRAVTVLAVNTKTPTNQRDAEARDEVLVEVAEIATASTLPVIVVGDLNATRWSYSFRAMRDDGGLKDSEDGFGFQGTWSASTIPWLDTVVSIPVDHVLTTPSVTTTTRELGPRMGSAHLPLMVELALAGT